MVDGQWSMVDGLWSMVDGRWSMVDGQWSMVDGRWSMVYGQWSMVNGLWSMVNNRNTPANVLSPATLTGSFLNLVNRMLLFFLLLCTFCFRYKKGDAGKEQPQNRKQDQSLKIGLHIFRVVPPMRDMP